MRCLNSFVSIIKKIFIWIWKNIKIIDKETINKQLDIE